MSRDRRLASVTRCAALAAAAMWVTITVSGCGGAPAGTSRTGTKAQARGAEDAAPSPAQPVVEVVSLDGPSGEPAGEHDYRTLAYARYAAAVALEIEAQRLEELFTYQRMSRGTRQPSLLRDARAFRQKALEALEEALTHDPQSSAVIRRKGDVLLQLGRGEEAAEHYRLADTHGFADPRWYFRAAGQMEMLGRRGDAAALLERMASPDSTAAPELKQIALLELGDLYIKLEQLARAESAIRQAISLKRIRPGQATTPIGAALATQLQDDPTGMRRLLVAVLMRQGRLDEALNEAAEAARQEPGDPRALAALVSVYEARGEKGEALSATERFVEANPGSPMGTLALISALAGVGRVEDAAARAEAYLAAEEGDVKMRQEVVRIFRDAGAEAEAVRFATSFDSGEAPAYPVAMSLLEMHVGAGEKDKAFELAEQILARNTMELNVALQVTGLLWSGLESDDCEEFCRRYAASYPDDARVTYAYAQMMRSRGRHDLAGELFVDVARSGAHYGDAYEAAARHLARRGEHYEALRLFLKGVDNGFVGRPEMSIQALIDGAETPAELAGRLAADAGDYNAALTPLYETIAGLYLDAYENALAEEYYRKALEAPAPQLMDYAGLAIALYRQKKSVEAIALVEDLIRKGRGAPPLARMLVAMLSQDGAHEEARRIAQTLVREQPTDIDNRLSLVGVYLEEEDYAAAEAELAIALDLAEGDGEGLVRVRYMLGIVYDELGRDEEAVKAWRSNLAAAPDDADTNNALGYHYAQRGTNLDEALKLVEKALATDADNGAYLDTLGWVYYRMKDYPRAVEALKRAAELEQDAVIFDHLGDALIETGDVPGALGAWQTSLTLKPKDKDRRKTQEKILEHSPEADLAEVE